MNLNQKIGLIVLVPVIVLLGLLAGSRTVMTKMVVDEEQMIREQFMPIISEDLPAMKSYEAALSTMLEADRDAHQAVIAETLSLSTNEDSEWKACDKANEENLQQTWDRMKKASEKFTSPETKKEYEVFIAAFQAWKEKSRRVLELAHTPGKLQFAQKINGGSGRQLFDEMRTHIDNLTTMLEKESGKRFELVNERAKTAQEASQIQGQAAYRVIRWFMGVGGVAILLTIFIAWIIARGLTSAMTDLSRRLNEQAGQVGVSASEIGQTSQSVADGTGNQASAIEETSATMTEMSSVVKQNTDRLASADRMVSETRGLVEDGTKAVESMTTAMTRIDKTSKEVSKILKAIEEIAFQTNLLALNAAVEAARAGEAGMGFSVVAEEVRNLALRSTEAAKNTADLIQETVRSIQDGTVIAQDVSGRFGKIRQRTGELSGLLSEINVAGREQSQGIDQVGVAVQNIEQTTTRNAAAAEELASASQELAGQASRMRAAVEELVGIVSGK